MSRDRGLVGLKDVIAPFGAESAFLAVLAKSDIFENECHLDAVYRRKVTLF